MGRVSEDIIGDETQALVVSLHYTAKFTTTGVGIHAAGHPQHLGRLWNSLEGTQGILHVVPIPERRRKDCGAGGHTPAIETGGSGTPRPNTDGT